MFKMFAYFSVVQFISGLGIEFRCGNDTYYSTFNDTVFTCIAAPDALNVFEENENVTEVTRSEEIPMPKVMENSDVKLIKIYNQKLIDLPNELGTFFAETEGLEVVSSGLRIIRKKSLQSFEKLKYLNVRKNKIEVLGHNLFDENNNLQVIIISCNKLKIICADTLASLPHLTHVDLRRNACISRKAQTDTEISSLLGEISRKCPPSIEVYCTFDDLEFPSDIIYGCEVRFWIIAHDYMTVSDFLGRHQGSKDNFHIKSLRACDMTTKYFPINLVSNFPRLEAIDITGGRLQRLEQRDIKPFPRLKILWLPRNEIETLANDVFEKNLELEKISFFDNRLMFIGTEILKPLNRLWYINFELNECIDGEASNKNLMRIALLEVKENCQTLS